MGELEFDVRKTVCNPDDPDAAVQHVFDMINVMVIAIGPFPFAELFNNPFLDILPGMRRNSEKAIEQGLIPDPAALRKAFDGIQNGLESSGPALTLTDFYTTDPDTLPPSAVEGFRVMREQRFCVPFVTFDAGQRAAAGPAIATFTAGAGALTEKDLFTMPKRDLTEAQRDAIQAAKDAAILGQKNNNKACNDDVFPNQCYDALNKFCSIEASGYCTADSDR